MTSALRGVEIKGDHQLQSRVEALVGDGLADHRDYLPLAARVAALQLLRPVEDHVDLFRGRLVAHHHERLTVG